MLTRGGVKLIVSSLLPLLGLEDFGFDLNFMNTYEWWDILWVKVRKDVVIKCDNM